MNLATLVSETRNPATMELDSQTTLAMMTLFNQEYRKAPLVLPEIARGAMAATRMKAGD